MAISGIPLCLSVIDHRILTRLGYALKCLSALSCNHGKYDRRAKAALASSHSASGSSFDTVNVFDEFVKEYNRCIEDCCGKPEDYTEEV